MSKLLIAASLLACVFAGMPRPTQQTSAPTPTPAAQSLARMTASPRPELTETPAFVYTRVYVPLLRKR